MSSTTISTTMNKSLIAFSRQLLEDTITAIATKHSLDVSETLREFLPAEFLIESKKEPAKKEPAKKEKPAKNEKPAKLEKPVKTEQPAFVLPWCGQIKDCWCNALRANYGLYTQCTMPPLPGESYCKTCSKHAAATDDGIPPCGTVQQRIAVDPFEYRDPKGKKATLYSAYMKKYKLTPETVRQEATKFGFTVPQQQFDTISSGRGRPKKSIALDDSTSEHSDSHKKKIGRPKKTSHNELTPEDLVAAAMTSSSPPPSPPPSLNFTTHTTNSPTFQNIALTPTSDDEL